MKNFIGAILVAFSSIVYGYGQTTFGDKVAILKVEDADGVLDRSGVIMLQSAMVEAFTRLQNVDVVDYSRVTPEQGGAFQFAEIISIGQRVSAGMVVIPSVAKINEHEIFLSAKMLNVQTKIMEASVDVRCDIRDRKSQAAIFKNSCEDLAAKLSGQILKNQMQTIMFRKGKLYRDGMALSEKEIKFFLADKYWKWKDAEKDLIRGQKWMVVASVFTSLGVSMTAAGIYGMIATEGWPDDDPYRAMSIAGIIVGPITIPIGGLFYCYSKSKKAGWQEMEDIFLEKQRSGYRAELNFGTQRYGVGFALKF